MKSPINKDYIDNGPAGTVNKYGFVESYAGSSIVHLWTVNTKYPFSTFATPVSLEVVSTSDEDKPGGTGVSKLVYEGIDSTGLETRFEVELNGVTPVPLSGQFLAINRKYAPNESAGTNQRNVGTINTRVAGAGAVVAQIAIGQSQTQQCVYRLPVNKKGRLKKVYVGLLQNINATLDAQIISVARDCNTCRNRGDMLATQTKDGLIEYKNGGASYEPLEWVAIELIDSSVPIGKLKGGFDIDLELINE